MDRETKIALGGGCHWCTEAVFQALKGVANVSQGYIASTNENQTFSEAVVVHFNPEAISLQTLIKIHLYTHKSTSAHAMRDKYRSAVYYFSDIQKAKVENILHLLQADFENGIITQALHFSEFKPSREAIQNYYQKNPEKPFCERFINPKLKLLLNNYSHQVNFDSIPNKLKHT